MLIFQNVRSRMFQEIMSNLKSFVSKIKATPLNTSQEIATAILLTGGN